ncbi:MAG: hypothetical protein [Caudoviricetes sp.]|nr:MAG: hypothetical protein [Caudoviricetes sp.]
MRVIETFVTTVPREKIPEDANWFMQDWQDGLLKVSESVDLPEKGRNVWLRKDTTESLINYSHLPVSTDAAETVVTRKELMKAYDLVEQGYTLWFGGDCPVEKGILVDVVYRDNAVIRRLPAKEGSAIQRDASITFWDHAGWENDIIAYRLSEEEDKSLSLPPLSEEKIKAIKANIKYKGHMDWSGGSFNSMAIDPESGEYEYEGNNLVVITKDEWNTYLDSIKIEVGDTVSFVHSDVFYEVLYVGKEKAFIKDSDGTEYSFPLEELSKVVK